MLYEDISGSERKMKLIGGNMKKILFVTDTLNVGGMERVQVDIANALSRWGYDVTIILHGVCAEENFEDQLDASVELIKVPKRQFPFRSKLPYIHRFYKKEKWEYRASPRALYRYYVGSKVKYDVEIAFYRGPSVKIISGSTNRKSKKFTWVHNDYRLVDEKTITRFFNSMAETKAAHKKFDKIIAVSEEAKQSFIETIGLPEKCETIYNMISCQTIRQKSLEKCPLEKKIFTMISVGRLIEAKGYELLLKVLKRLNEDGLQFEFWLVGYGGLEQKLKQYVSDNHLSNVKILGKQMNPYCYMRQADLYVCSSWREGFSLVVAEAMACGTPAVSTRCTGPVEILGDGKYGILMDYDENSMYETLKSIITNPQVLSDFRKNAYERSKCFDENVIVNDLVKLFE